MTFPTEIHHQFFGLGHIELEMDPQAPVHKILHEISVLNVIILLGLLHVPPAHMRVCEGCATRATGGGAAHLFP